MSCLRRVICKYIYFNSNLSLFIFYAFDSIGWSRNTYTYSRYHSFCRTKSLYSLINYFIFGIVGYCTIRTALYLWNISQQQFIQDFNNKYKGIMIRKYFISNNTSFRADLLSFIINDFKYLESNYIKSLFY